jgi:DNA-binding protein H-NS
MQTYSAVAAEIARLQAQAEKLRESEKAGLIAQARKAIDAYGITAADLGFGPGKAGGAGRGKPTSSAASAVGVAKYRDPATGKTWTGRGKPPTWISGAKDRDAFLIGNDAASGTQEANGASKRRSRQAKPKASSIGAPKYRDAATGKTWTGRGKPPLWIVGAKNRDDYLIKAE